MSRPSFLTKSVTIRGVDANDIRVSETAGRDAVVISIQQNDDGSRIASVRLNQAQFDAMCQTRYSMDLDKSAGDPELPEVA